MAGASAPPAGSAEVPFSASQAIDTMGADAPTNVRLRVRATDGPAAGDLIEARWSDGALVPTR